MFLREDRHLLEIHANERSMTHRVGIYLQQEFPGWNVDCEYNRQGAGGDPKQDADGSRRFPDVIVHRRGLDENLLVIEAKKNVEGQESAVGEDRDKLRSMITEFGYQYAYLLIFSESEPHLSFERISLEQA
jgi:hypothetical protein